MTYQELQSLSIAISKKVLAEAGPTSVALYIEGGQGVAPSVFQITKLPKKQFDRIKKEDHKILAYARRKGLAKGIYPKNRFNFVPVAWMGTEAYVWRT